MKRRNIDEIPYIEFTCLNIEFSVLPPCVTDHAYNMTGTLNRRRPMYQHRCNSHFVNLLGLFYSVEDTCTFE